MKQELSAREIDIINGLSRGLSNLEVGAKLGISVNTVRAHIQRISEKLDTTGRAGIVGEAYRRNYLKVG